MEYKFRRKIGEYLKLMKGTMKGILTMNNIVGEPFMVENNRYSLGNERENFSKNYHQISKKEKFVTLDKKLLD